MKKDADVSLIIRVLRARITSRDSLPLFNFVVVRERPTTMMSLLLVPRTLPDILVIVFPSISLLYALVSHIFVTAWGECRWNTHLSALLPRLSLLVAVLAVQCSNILWILLVAAVSIYLVRDTRIQVIEGGPPPIIPYMKDKKIVVITGANAGIGYHTTEQLAQRGATVVMCCRSVSRAEQARDQILKDNPATISPQQLQLLQLDLGSLQSVRQAAQELSYRHSKIDILINNAGLMMGTQEMTQDGYDLVMQANHLGHYLWTRLLLEHQAGRPMSRILNITSSTYVLASKMDVEDLFCQSRRRYSLFGQYAQSKLANILFTTELAKRYPTIQAHALHPGLVRTDVTRNMPWYLRCPNVMFASILATLQKTPAQGAWNTTYVATCTHLTPGHNGSYWVNRSIQPKRPCAVDPEAAQQLWQKSAELVEYHSSVK